MLYRVLDHITVYRTGEAIPAGTLSKLESISNHSKAILTERGIIAPVEGPPLDVLPGWAELADQLAMFGIVTVVDLMEADREQISMGLGVQPSDVAVWQKQAEEYVK